MECKLCVIFFFSITTITCSWTSLVLAAEIPVKCLFCLGNIQRFSQNIDQLIHTVCVCFFFSRCSPPLKYNGQRFTAQYTHSHTVYSSHMALHFDGNQFEMTVHTNALEICLCIPREAHTFYTGFLMPSCVAVLSRVFFKVIVLLYFLFFFREIFDDDTLTDVYCMLHSWNWKCVYLRFSLNSII